MPPELPRVRVVIVTFNSAKVIAACLDSLDRDVKTGLIEVVVVDNGSNDGTDDIIAAYPSIRLMRSSNRGFGAGNNLGANGAQPDYLFFLNPDTVVEEAAIGALSKFLDAHPRTTIAGPAVLDDNGTTTVSYHRFLTPLLSIWSALGLHRLIPINRIDSKTQMSYSPITVPGRVDRLIGAAIMVRRVPFESVAGFDEDYFLFSEEEDLCYRFAEGGGEVWYFPRAKVTHTGSHSAGVDSAFTIASTVRGRDQFLRKHFSDVAAILVRFIWIAMLLLRLLATMLSSTSKERRKGLLLGVRCLLDESFYDRVLRPGRNA